MTIKPSDTLIYKIDEFVSRLELMEGYDGEKIIDAMLEYIEIIEDLGHV